MTPKLSESLVRRRRPGAYVRIPVHQYERLEARLVDLHLALTRIEAEATTLLEARAIAHQLVGATVAPAESDREFAERMLEEDR